MLVQVLVRALLQLLVLVLVWVLVLVPVRVPVPVPVLVLVRSRSLLPPAVLLEKDLHLSLQLFRLAV